MTLEDEDKKKIYGKGFEEGLKQAWNSIVRLTTRGHSVHEIRMIAKGNVAAIPNRVTERLSEIDPSTLLPKEAPVYQLDMRAVSEGRGCIVKERAPDRSFLIFMELVEGGAKGLCVARIHPDELRDRFGMEGVRLVWLTRSEKKETILEALGAEDEFVSPTNLAGLASLIVKFMEEEGGAVILEGTEYLITHNGFDPVLKFLMKINEKALLREVTFLVSIDPATMDIREYQLLSREIGREI